jgi:NADH dehydrogenase
MYLIAGGTGRLGTAVTRRLLAAGVPVRVLTRAPSRGADLARLGAQIVPGDVRDAASLAVASRGVDKVFDAVQAFDGTGANNPRTVDAAGNRALIDAAVAAGVGRFVFVSVLGVHPDHPMEFFRIKHATEQYLRRSGLSYTVLRPAAFMEFWAALVGQPILDRGETRVFGRGDNPINFVSVEDVAQLALRALADEALRGQTIEFGGPENLTLDQVAALFARVAGRPPRVRHVPLPAMRVMRLLTRPLNPTLSRLIGAGIAMDTADMAFDAAPALARFGLPGVRLEEVARRMALARAGDVDPAAQRSAP